MLFKYCWQNVLKSDHARSYIFLVRGASYDCINAVDKVCIHPYYKALYKAMHLVAFNAFLRVGEMTSDVANNDGHCLQHRDVVVDKQDCVINFKSYKHSA
jgi:hypothetical protein